MAEVFDKQVTFLGMVTYIEQWKKLILNFIMHSFPKTAGERPKQRDRCICMKRAQNEILKY